MMSQEKTQLSSQSLSRLFCPFCGHYLMKQRLTGGYIEIKCKDCKQVVILRVDETRPAIVISVQN